MESELSPDKQTKEAPAVPLKTYQWEDLRRSRDAGGYPWTHLLKAPLTDEITAEDIIRETTPRRSMSREFSRSRTRSPVDMEGQKILNLDSSPGSSRKHNEEGQDEGIHIPNFSKEVSLDSEEEAHQALRPPSQSGSHLSVTLEIPKNVSPKGILKRRLPDHQFVAVSESRGKTKCCHPLVNKIKHLADKTLQKLEKSDGDKSPLPKHKKVEEIQEIRQLKSSPSARRKKFSAIKLGDSDEMSKTLPVPDSSLPRNKKEHIYEDIEDKSAELISQDRPHLTFREEDLKDEDINNQKDTGSIAEKKSNASQDPSLVTDETISLAAEEHIMEKLHKLDNIPKEVITLNYEMDTDEPNVEEIFQNQLDERRPKRDSPNITITEIFDDNSDPAADQSIAVPIEMSPSPSPIPLDKKLSEAELATSDWSKPNSDHEYEIIEKPTPQTTYNDARLLHKAEITKTDDELSSTTSLERKFLQHTSDEDDQTEDKVNLGKGESLSDAEALQRDIEDRYFVNTPSTISRTECDVSTSQVDSSALENLPLKRGSRGKNAESIDSKIQQRIKEGTGKLKTQAGKLKTKLQNIKTKQFSMPERPKFSFPDRAKFNLPERRKFSLPERPKFKKINITEKIHFKDRKFTLPDRPKFNVPDFSKFKMPDRPKINFPSLGRKKEERVETNSSDSSPDLRDVGTVEFESKTYPRLFHRKKKQDLPKTSSSPTLNREDTPPATFTFTRVKKSKPESSTYVSDSSEQPREYGNLDVDTGYGRNIEDRKQFDKTYDFDKMDTEYLDEESPKYTSEQNSMTRNISTTNQENSHINEINNDEFFVRPRGISRENIQVREYLSDEIRQAFKIPKNILAQMGSNVGIDDSNMYTNELDADPDLLGDDDEPIHYSTEDLNDKDDGYYTFPPVRPSRAKRKKKEKENESLKYIDDSVNASIQFSEVDLCLPDEHDLHEIVDPNVIVSQENIIKSILKPVHEYANDDIIRYEESIPIQSQTLPMPPKRKKQFPKKEYKHSSLNDFKEVASSEMWNEPENQSEDIIVYRTEHEYKMPAGAVTITEQSPVPPRRNRSQSSRGTSLCDDDRTSHGAESLTLDTHIPQPDIIDYEREIRHESPGYAQVQKGPVPDKGVRRSKSKTPPVRRRKSNSSERKYYTVGPTKPVAPDRPPRKKSSTSLMTLDRLSKRSVSADLTQYVEIDEPFVEDSQKEKCLISGEVVNKMKDRPLPPPPRPPRLPKKTKKHKKHREISREPDVDVTATSPETATEYLQHQQQTNVVEIEVSTQTDPLPDDVDLELGIDEHLDISMSSSLHDIVDEDSVIRGRNKLAESPRVSRPTSRSEKSLKLSDPKISELSKPIGRTSPTVILVERRVSSPTRINEREEMLTEASLTVQHIDVDESQIPDVPPLPKSRGITKPPKPIDTVNEEQALERVTETSRDVMLDNLVTQRLQVRDLDVGRLNVSELQASKIFVSDIEGMTLQVTELDSKSGHVSVSGIEFSQSVIDEIVKKFAEITTTQPPQVHHVIDYQRPANREEQTQTEVAQEKDIEMKESTGQTSTRAEHEPEEVTLPPSPPPRGSAVDAATPPVRPPPPDLTPLLYSYLQDLSFTPSSFYTPSLRERTHGEYHEPHQAPSAMRRVKRKRAAPHSDSSSDEERPRPSPRRMPPFKSHEPSITEAGAQFFRVCHNSISRTLRHVFNSFMSYISGTEDKKDMQMALVIFLVLIAGLIMFGLSDSRTIHHHHWEFFNPPDTKK